MSTRYQEDPAESTVNTTILNQEFNTSNKVISTEKEETQLQDIQDMRNELLSLMNEKVDPDDIIYDNIDRANRILDKAEEQIKNGDITNRFIEVVSALINAITTAATQIAGQGYNNVVLEQKTRALDIKEQEVAVKALTKQTQGKVEGDQNITNNLLITGTREDLLKMINGELKNGTNA